ncbi:MAG: hypothetical protein HY465_03485 [Deltaproteobacteria bacterium]|nr:hypothetical protein [Deltaproteobacteria bacterium]
MKMLIALVFLSFTSCSVGDDIFDDLGTNISSPTGLAVDSTNRRLYVTNSNSGVNYDWEQGSLQIVDIATPQDPELQGTAATLSFSGEVYVDIANNRAYVANRFSEGEGAASDRLLVVDVSTPTDPFVVEEVSAQLNPFAVDCCAGDSGNLLLSTSSQGVLQYGSIGGSSLTLNNVDILQTLSNGFLLSRATVTDVEIVGTWAFLSRNEGGILVINLGEIADTSKNPVDYFIDDIRSPRGLAASGTKLLVADEDIIDGTLTSRVVILETSVFTASNATDTTVIQQSYTSGDQSLLVATVSVGRDPQRIEVAGTQAFVTNMDDDTVSVISLESNSPGTPIAVGDQPFGVAVDSPGGIPTTLYVGNFGDNTISIIDILDGSTTRFTVVGTYP